MIAHLAGKITEKVGTTVVLDVGGVGYEVALPAQDAERLALDEVVKVYTYHHVREQAEELFGFSSLEAKKLFELLISVQGIGPKAAMAILSLDAAAAVRNAIASSDAGFIARAAGVGKKSAERVIVDLADKVGLPTAGAGMTVAAESGMGDEALEALMALGYTLNDASVALKTIDRSLPTEDRIRLALKTR
jgi:Holliday junction DNA helicase RuvA